MAAMALNLIVEELITGSAGVVYSDNGSAQSCVGNYVVQFMPVNGDQSNENRRQKLADLVRRTVSILPTIFAYKYSWEILKKMDFVKSNSRDHNLKVMEKVCKDDRIEKALLVVICNVHLLMMLQISEKDQKTSVRFVFILFL